MKKLLVNLLLIFLFCVYRILSLYMVKGGMCEFGGLWLDLMIVFWRNCWLNRNKYSIVEMILINSLNMVFILIRFLVMNFEVWLKVLFLEIVY